MDNINITEISASDVSVYKVVPESDGSLLGYNSICRDSASPAPTSWDDWANAMYLQFQSDHALGTVPYRWEKGYTHAKLIKATFNGPLKIVIIDSPIMYDGTISGKEKATRIKLLLGIDESLPLMETLGKQGKFAMIRETKDEWELIVSQSLLATTSFKEEVVAIFERHSQMPVTHRWCDSNGKWHKWTDTFNAKNRIPNLAMDWMHDSSI